ncbi:hypothetical protein [Methanosalsum natronophilum]|uniref:hypothetical protein n=1 Tax=Methanosalsum natronophilum TaxID=768733 RepID=UPI0021694AF6|nr:hypothetical protein [Methanosalsum natronophilum]MCS3923350.1 putative transcriptional regulator [Methanosalsum natronophilum]
MLFDQVNKELDICIRHLRVLKKVVDEEPIGILRLAEEIGMPTHKVRYSLRVLEQQNLIKPSSQGAIAGDKVDEFFKNFDTDLQEIMNRTKSIQELGSSK